MDSNLALITTLYNTPRSDFYKDIYFPLIRYAILCIYNEYADKEKHYDVTALQEKINEKSGVQIPLHVLRTSICALAQKGETTGISAATARRAERTADLSTFHPHTILR